MKSVQWIWKKSFETTVYNNYLFNFFNIYTVVSFNSFIFIYLNSLTGMMAIGVRDNKVDLRQPLTKFAYPNCDNINSLLVH